MKTNSVFYGGDGRSMDIAILATSIKQAIDIHNAVPGIPWESATRMRTHWSKMPNDNSNYPELHNQPTGIYYKSTYEKSGYRPLTNYEIARRELDKAHKS